MNDTTSKLLASYTIPTRATLPEGDTGADITVSVNTTGITTAHVEMLARREISRNVQEMCRKLKTKNPSMWRVMVNERKLAYNVHDRLIKGSMPGMTAEQVQASFVATKREQVLNGEITVDDAKAEVLAMFADLETPKKDAKAA